MRRVCVVCEGQTEETFVRDVLAPAFYTLGLNLMPQMIETSAGHRGGALKYERVRRHLHNTLRQPSAPVVTTLFDLYRLDANFPACAEVRPKPLDQRLAALTDALHTDIIGLVKCPPDRFLPYFQPFEFEALLFSDVPTLTATETEWAGAAPSLQAIRDAAETPEHINDGSQTKPAAQLERHLTRPNYRKTLHGPVVASLIGLAKIEAECPFFAGWLRRLREIPPL